MSEQVEVPGLAYAPRSPSVKWLVWQTAIAVCLFLIPIYLAGTETPAARNYSALLVICFLVPSEYFRQFGTPPRIKRFVSVSVSDLPVFRTFASRRRHAHANTSAPTVYLRTLERMMELYPDASMVQQLRESAEQLAEALERSPALQHNSAIHPEIEQIRSAIREQLAASGRSDRSGLPNEYMDSLQRLWLAAAMLRAYGLTLSVVRDEGKPTAVTIRIGPDELHAPTPVDTQSIELLEPMISGRSPIRHKPRFGPSLRFRPQE